MAARREQAVIEVAQGKEVEVKGSQELTLFMPEWLSLELIMLGDLCKGREVTTIQDVVSIPQDLQQYTQSMLSELERPIKLCLSLPISVAVSERSFSALRRLKTWLYNTMTQERLTHLAMMHAHNTIWDVIDVPTTIGPLLAMHETETK